MEMQFVLNKTQLHNALQAYISEMGISASVMGTTMHVKQGSITVRAEVNMPFADTAESNQIDIEES